MLRKSLQHICTSLEIEEALTSIGLLATVSDQCVLLFSFVFIFMPSLNFISSGILFLKGFADPHELLMFTVKARGTNIG